MQTLEALHCEDGYNLFHDSMTKLLSCNDCGNLGDCSWLERFKHGSDIEQEVADVTVLDDIAFSFDA